MNTMLIDEMARDLAIIKEPYEDDFAWQFRVKYSVLGLQVLSSLHDSNDSIEETVDNSVSHQHVTNRAKELAGIFEIEDVEVDNIIGLYKITGFILSKRNRITYPKITIAKLSECCLARGVHPSTTIGVSGLGILLKSDNVGNNSVDEMFNLVPFGIKQWFKLFTNSINNWKSFDEADTFEYLNVDINNTEKYWTDKPPKQFKYALCRSKDGLRYHLLLSKQDRVKCALLPEWRTRGGEYFHIAIALRILARTPPRAKISRHRSTAIIEYDYLLPPAEQNFIELCSWQKDKNANDYTKRLNRIAAIGLCQSIIAIFKRMGYTLEEE